MSSNEGFAKRLKEARTAAELTQEQLGFAVDVTKSSISAWENGREMPSLRNLPKLRAALGCSLDHLICGSPFHFETDKKIADKSNYITARDSQEAALLESYRNMPGKQQKALLSLLRN